MLELYTPGVEQLSTCLYLIVAENVPWPRSGPQEMWTVAEHWTMLTQVPINIGRLILAGPKVSRPPDFSSAQVRCQVQSPGHGAQHKIK